MKYNENVIRSKYQLVPRTLVFIRRGEEYLFIHKKKQDSFGYEKLNGIGGHIEKGEEPFESATREIHEETGLHVKDLNLAAIVFIDISINPGILMFVFSAKNSSGQIQNSEEGELIWINREQISSREDVVKDVPFLIELTENHKSGEPPQLLKYLYDEKKELRIVINS